GGRAPAGTQRPPPRPRSPGSPPGNAAHHGAYADPAPDPEPPANGRNQRRPHGGHQQRPRCTTAPRGWQTEQASELSGKCGSWSIDTPSGAPLPISPPTRSRYPIVIIQSGCPQPAPSPQPTTLPNALAVYVPSLCSS